MSTLSHALACILSFELLIGGQARLPFSPTPSIHRNAMAKADGLKKTLRWIPLESTHLTYMFGALMCLASALVAIPTTRAQGSMLSGSISLVGVFSKAFAPPYLPVANTLLAAAIWWIS